MIKLQELTPKVYYEHSRDFQLIGRLYDLVLNYTKTQADTIYNLPFSDNFNTKLIDLMTMTLGFKSKHNYNLNQLRALCSAFVEILRNKGTKYAINLACNVITNAEGVTENIVAEVYEEEYRVDFFVPETLSDVNLLKDLMTYILPAGMTFNIIRSVMKQASSATEITYVDTVVANNIIDQKTSKIISKLEFSADNTAGVTFAETTPGNLFNATVINPNRLESLSAPELSLIAENPEDPVESDSLEVSNINNNAAVINVYKQTKGETGWIKYTTIKKETSNGK